MGSDKDALQDQVAVNIRKWSGRRKQKPVRRYVENKKIPSRAGEKRLEQP